MTVRQRQLTVLVAGPRANAAAFIADCLSGTDVEAAADSGGALERLAQHRGKVSVAFIDCESPGRPDEAGGLALIRTIATIYPWIPIAGIVGAGSDASLVIEAVRGGARDFLRFPLAEMEVKQVTDRLLRRRRSAARGPIPNAAVATVIAFVEQHYDAPLSVDTLARMAGTSRWYFSRIFAKLAGKPFREFLTDLRVARALELLRRRDRSVTQVAHEVGFYDLSHFDRVIRRRFGCSPRELARRKPARG